MAEGFHTVKKYERADGSAKPTVQATRGDGPHTPINKLMCKSAFQICEIKVVQLLGGKKKSAQICGTILLHHPRGDWKLYNRDKVNAETIKVPGSIEVIPPGFCVLPHDPVAITFKFDKESELAEMNSRFVSWLPDNPRGEVLVRTLRGKKSTMEVSFVVFSKVILADIGISLDNIVDGEGIFGTIKASFKEKVPGLESFLVFNKQANDCVRVKAGEPIPLLRSFIAVPLENGLVLDMDLHTISGVPVAGGNISFCPDSFGDLVGGLGKEGEIQVKANVGFCCFKHHYPTFMVHEAFRALMGLEISRPHQGLEESAHSGVRASA